MNAVTFTVVGIARPKGSMKAFTPRGWHHAIVTADNPATKSWQHLVAVQAQLVARQGQFLGPVAVRVTFLLPRPESLPRRYVAHTKKPDVDKLMRGVCDALSGVLYRDDAQVVELHARKLYAAVGSAPRAEITVAEAAWVATTIPSADQPWLLEELEGGAP